MKLRIKGNSLRLRLTQTEVKDFQENGRVEEVINFGLGSDAQLQYVLQRSSKPKISVSKTSTEIVVEVPQAIAAEWTNTTQVGFSEKITIGNGEYLSVLVEKDFKCLQVREGEDEGDMFPNPEEGSLKC